MCYTFNSSHQSSQMYSIFQIISNEIIISINCKIKIYTLKSNQLKQAIFQHKVKHLNNKNKNLRCQSIKKQKLITFFIQCLFVQIFIYSKKNQKKTSRPKKQVQKPQLFTIKEEPSKVGESYVDQAPIKFNQLSMNQGNQKKSFNYDEKFHNFEIKFNKMKKAQPFEQKTKVYGKMKESKRQEGVKNVRTIKFLKFVYKDQQVVIKMPQIQVELQDHKLSSKTMKKTEEKTKFDDASQSTKQTASNVPEHKQKDNKRYFNGYLSSIQQQQTSLFKKFTTPSSNQIVQQSRRIQFASYENSSSNNRTKQPTHQQVQDQQDQYDEIAQNLDKKYEHYPSPHQSQQNYYVTQYNYDKYQGNKPRQQHQDQRQQNIVVGNNGQQLQQNRRGLQNINVEHNNNHINGFVVLNEQEEDNEPDIANLSTNCTMNPGDDSSRQRLAQLQQQQQPPLQYLLFYNPDQDQDELNQQTMSTKACESHQEEPMHVIRLNVRRYRLPQTIPTPQQYSSIIYNAQLNLYNYRRIKLPELIKRLNIYLFQMKQFMEDKIVGLYDEERQELWTILISMMVENYNGTTMELMKNFLVEYETSPVEKQNYYEMQYELIQQKLQSIEIYNMYAWR